VAKGPNANQAMAHALMHVSEALSELDNACCELLEALRDNNIPWTRMQTARAQGIRRIVISAMRMLRMLVD